MIEQCPMLAKCHKMSGMECANREFRKCSFFKECMLTFCKKIKGLRAKSCKYSRFCKDPCKIAIQRN